MTARTAVLARLARRAAWAPLAVIALHSLAAELFGHEPYVDPVVHFLGGMAAALFMLQACTIAPTLLGSLQPVGRDLLAFGTVCAAALLWEIGEFASDQLLGTHVQRSLDNTMRDLILGATGGLLCIAAARAVRSRTMGTR